MLQKILSAFGLNDASLKWEALGSGLINQTWKITERNKEFVLQQVNQYVFKNPHLIADNINLVAGWLQEKCPDYFFVAPLPALNGNTLVQSEDGNFYRLFPFVKDSVSYDVVPSASQAFEAAAQFGRFTKLLSGLNTSQLHATIPGFHDLSLRYKQFLFAIENGNQQRIAENSELISEVQSLVNIVEAFEDIKRNPAFKMRVTHHDTKISNVLFDMQGKSICVIDLDTVMPGYFISDVGDMMRTYLSPVSEEETDLGRIEVRDEFYKAVVQGYYSEMKDELSETEKKYFFYAGEFIIYMQALRFLTDYLNDDVYYGEKYPGHNLARARNQMVLLRRLQEKRNLLMQIV